MLRTYLKIAWRNIVYNKGYAIIHIPGLALGMSCFIYLPRMSILKKTMIGKIFRVESQLFKGEHLTDDCGLPVIALLGITFLTISLLTVKATIANPPGYCERSEIKDDY